VIARRSSRAHPVVLGAGLVSIAGALLPPMERASHELFAIHMAQHLVLGLVAPMLIVAGVPMGPSRRVRGHAGAVGLLAVFVHAATWWVWHAPVVFDAALRHDPLHALEHATLFASGLGLWWVIRRGVRERREGLAVMWLFLAGLQAGALAALLTLAPTVLYTAPVTAAHAVRLTPLEDQQLAGAVMWVPGGLVYLVAAVVVVVRWLETGRTRAARSAPARAPAPAVIGGSG